jgi:hypothetical protein
MGIYYRADKRCFEPGATIGTAGEFMLLHSEDGRLTEELLAQRKPQSKPNRGECLMLFEEEECAKDYWAKLAAGKLYTINMSSGSILHRGDMHIIDEIAAKLKKGERADELADSADTGIELTIDIFGDFPRKK